jgi:hypothetical protein
MENASWLPDLVRATGEWVGKNGFAAFIACLLLLVLYKVAMKFIDKASEIAKPAAQRLLAIADEVKQGHDRFIDSSLASQDKLDTCLEKQGECLDGQGRTLDELKEHSVTHTTLLTLLVEQTKPALKKTTRCKR